MVAQYRQTVLAAFQNVEDNLATLRILDAEMAKQNQAVVTAKKSLELILNEYKAGTVALADTLNAELTLFTAVKGANDISYRRMVASVGLINALGGGWDATDLTQIH
jgi:outer membrane protein TolC